MNEKYTSDLGPLRILLPTRLTKPGIQPTMKSKCVNNKEILADDDWVYPPLIPTREETRLIMCHLGEIGTRTIFENFLLTTNNKEDLLELELPCVQPAWSCSTGPGVTLESC